MEKLIVNDDSKIFITVKIFMHHKGPDVAAVVSSFVVYTLGTAVHLLKNGNRIVSCVLYTLSFMLVSVNLS